MNKRIIYFSIVAGFVVLSVFRVVFSAEAIPSPTISVVPDIYYPLDDVLYLEGRAEPNVAVQIQFQKSGAKPITVVTRSDQNGEWVFAGKIPLGAGDWEVRARIIKNERVSAWSNPRIIRAIVSGIVLGGVTVKFAWMAFFITILLATAGGFAWHYRWRVKIMSEEREKIIREKERESVMATVEKNFIELRQKTIAELDHIEQRLVDGELTKEEKEHREHLLRELREAEEAIEKKVKNL